MGIFGKDYVLTDRLLGAGTFGRVYMAIEQMARRQVACKVVDLRKLGPRPSTQFGRPEQPATAEEVDSVAQRRKVKAWANQQKRGNALKRKICAYYREVEILASISHPNIVSIEKVYITDNTIYIMQDLVTGGDLFSYIELKNGKLLEVEAAVIVRQIVVALGFLHGKNIVHRDIKPDNVLMTSLAAGCRVVLTDFGAARRIESKLHRMSSVIGTREYAAPEILGNARSSLELERPGYTRAVDMWAVGCVSVVLLTGGLAFCDPITNTYSEKLARDCNLQFLRRSKEWQAVRQRPKEFVEQLLVLDEAARMTAEEALVHSWFSNEAHKNDFEDLYQRTIRHWHPRTPKSQVVEFRDSGAIRNLLCSLGLRDNARRSNSRPPSPIEPPYKPFPRNMHLEIWPRRDPDKRLSEEVLSAIERWSPRSAESLRMRAGSSSPRARSVTSQPTDRGGMSASKVPRAASEPPQNRLSSRSQQMLAEVYSGSSRGTAVTEYKVYPTTRFEIGGLSSRTPSPKNRRALAGGRSRFPFSATSSSPSHTHSDNISGPQFKSVTGFGAAGANNALPESPSTKILRNIVNHNQNSRIADSDDESNSPSQITTPHRHGKLKRRVSTPLATPKAAKKKKRRGRGSIFELAEDSDTEDLASPRGRSDGRSIFDLADEDDPENEVVSSRADRGSPRAQRAPLVHRPKKVASAPGTNKPPPAAANLYLPR
ncbi:hypothetical protein, variant [Cladophialophora immunda]|uniref:Protein kinase domain-containing protein n=1 Tax=Cladophialophora immunda TaxID=569365 RepID=A0A0D2CAA1_9EURO|nr:uncharacterized protein PV07_07113 [Cladophialophora immunda]XP_016247586.1 hypothetical protein, variant [Cladophialophora immunda]KIW27369.1 hypothetical protein PV07_07113 [Cladophialophora immunda]KIW27370.1 hypothetical protein, variant [Cladophialophora immunda]